MNENSKTLTYVGIAVLLLGAGIWLSRPVSESSLLTAELGKEFFPDFTDPMTVASAEIIDLDAVNAVKHDLKVARVDDIWEINPERQGYPDVSSERLANVVKAVIGVKKLAIVTDEAAKHRQFSVVDPNNEAELKEGTDGVGKRVTLVDGDKRKLVDLIFGKKDEKNPKLIYVREPNRDRIYATEIDTAPLSTSFADWVQPDMLKVGQADLRKVDIRDYAIDMRTVRQQLGPGGPVVAGSRPGLFERSKADVKKDDADKWELLKLETFDKDAKGFKEKKLTEEEEVDTAKLDALKGALAGLKIVDAKKKAKVLAEDLLKDKNFLNDPKSPATADDEAMMSLKANGFWISPKSQQGELELVPEEGELTVGFENGVQYLLRFGGIVRNDRADAGDAKKDGEAKADGQADAKKGEGADEGEATAPNRYLMVSASFNPDLIPKPPLTTLPPEGATPAAPAPAAPVPAATPTATATPAPAGTAPAPTPSATPSPTAPAPAATPTATPTASPTGSPTGSAKPADASTGSEGCETSGDACQQPEAPKPSATPSATPTATKPAATPTATAAPAPAATPPATATAKPPVTVSPDDGDTKPAAAVPAAGDPLKSTVDNLSKAAADALKPKETPKPMTPEERKRIEAENKRMQEKYEADLKAGREKATELNKEFARWYYVVSDSTFRSLDVDPTSLARKKGAAPANPNPAGGGMQGLPPEVLRQLQMQQMQRGR